MMGFPNKPMGFFFLLLKMISTWGVKWGGTPPFKETLIFLDLCLGKRSELIYPKKRKRYFWYMTGCLGKKLIYQKNERYKNGG